MKTALCGLMVLAFAAASASAQAQAAAGNDATAAKTAVTADVPDITVADLKKAMADQAVTLLDCNGSASYAKGHLPGAIDFDAAKANLAKLLPADKGTLIVAYCGGPKCLAYKQGIEAARKLGYSKLKHYSGGLSGWRKAEEKLEKK